MRADAVERRGVAAASAPEQRELAAHRRLSAPVQQVHREDVVAADRVQLGADAVEDPHAARLGRDRLEQGAAVELPRHRRARHLQDRGEHVDRLDVPVDDVAAPLARQLHDQRDGRQVLDVAGRDGAALDANVEADAVVRHHRDHRVVVEVEPPQAGEQLTEQAVRERDLQEMALVGDLHQPRHAEAELAVQTRNRLGRMPPVAPPGRIELPGHVRQQRVLEPEGRPGLRLDRPDEAAEALDLPARQVTRGVPGLRLAEARRAESRGLLGGVHLVAVLEEGEEVGGVRVDVRGQARARVAAVENRGDGERRAVVDRRRSSVPGGIARQAREGRITLRVDPAALADQGRERELVEDDHDDRLGARGAAQRRRAVAPSLVAFSGARPCGRYDQRQANQACDEHRAGDGQAENPTSRHESPA